MSRQSILGVSVLWAAAIVATAMLVKGAPNAPWVILILGTCQGMSVAIMGGSCRKSRDRASA